MSRARDFADLAGSADAGGLTGRNLIINGAMQVAQRGTSFTNLANGGYGLDRFHISKITGGAVDIKQTDDAPTASQAGYLLTKCLHADVTTADSSVAADDMYTIRQSIEYKNIAHVGFGQSGTRYVTASFWVKSTKTGTFCCYIKASGHNRAHTKEYTVSASDTWEYKKLTFPVDTSNSSVWNNNDSGGELGWTLYSGTNYHIAADTWTTTSNNYAPCTSNQVNALDSASNDFKITGVQLEVGEQATPFEHRSFGDELARCQRYYFKFLEGGTKEIGVAWYYTATHLSFMFRYPTTMRATPTATDTTGTNYYIVYRNGGSDAFNSVNFENGSTEQFSAFNNTEISGTAGQAGIVRSNNASAKIEFDAEL
jgi:hypothetical protein